MNNAAAALAQRLVEIVQATRRETRIDSGVRGTCAAAVVVQHEQRHDAIGSGVRARQHGVVAHAKIAGEQCDRGTHGASVR